MLNDLQWVNLRRMEMWHAKYLLRYHPLMLVQARTLAQKPPCTFQSYGVKLVFQITNSWFLAFFLKFTLQLPIILLVAHRVWYSSLSKSYLALCIAIFYPLFLFRKKNILNNSEYLSEKYVHISYSLKCYTIFRKKKK